MAQGVGNFVFFIREGTTVDSVTVSKTMKPDDDPASNWTNYELKSCEEIDSDVRVEKDEAFGPGASGASVKKGEVVTLQSSTFVATFNQLALLPYELLFGSGELTAGTQAQILSGSAQVNGWVRLRQLDSSNGREVLNATFWTQATIQGMNFAQGVIRPQITFPVLDAGALGVMTVNNLT